MIAEVTPPQAWKILRENPRAILLDVRSKVEFDYVGHPQGAVNVPLLEFPDWQVDTAFVGKVGALDGADDKSVPVLAICRSGGRSMMAAQLLEQAGYEQAMNIIEGFEGDLDDNNHRGNLSGWRFHKLPWEQT